MPRWKALPDDLDPQVREFASQLRTLVDRSGLSIAAVSDRTGYSKTSWERYLNGRLLAPKGAIVALAEVTGTPPVHLITMWELAERAWSRSEMRHDMTMQAIRISQARAALGGLASNPPGSSKESKESKESRDAAAGRAGKPSKAPKTVKAPQTPQTPQAPQTPNLSKDNSGSGRAARGGIGTVTGVAGPAGVSPTVPPVPRQQPAEREPEAVRQGAQAQAPAGSGGAPATPASRSYEASAPPGSVVPTASVAPVRPGGGPGSDGKSPDGQRRKRKLTMFLAGVVGALVVIAAAVFLTDVGKGDGDEKAKPSAAPSRSTAKLPAGVECGGADCAGKDPENMGCGREFARTTSRATIGTKTLVEVRYSKTCGAAWARVTLAAPGDEVRITGSGAGAGAQQRGTVDGVDGYTPMVAVRDAAAAKACVTLATGETGCTK
ncbi:helix-turn-helix domain-containing protein [Streptomyces aureocirculatus]|uniref:helix-turn-helix domain-containing protein n=1 Tax=Streptomyces aureocirculatus TaxID=67275 RepID=UPI0004C99B33|nr:XRE family transcriptional regulator [Streptomyces aureocirculatus]